MLEAKLRELPGIEDVSSDLQIKNPQVDGRRSTATELARSA